MKLLMTFCTVLLLIGTACQNPTPPDAGDNKEPLQFGAGTTTDNAIPFAQLTRKMGASDSLQTKVIGTVESVCQAKGCWVNIVTDAPNDTQEMFVKFKDYGFFMPKDIAGRQVVLDGYAFREVTPVDELRHYAEDEGKSAEEIAAITEPKEELKFMAAGVLLLPEKE